LGDELGDLSDDFNADFSEAAASEGGSTDDLFAESDSLLMDGTEEKSIEPPEAALDSLELDSGDLLDPDLAGELSADFSAMEVESSDDLELASFSDPEDSNADIDETDFSFEGDDKAPSPSLSSDDDLLGLDDTPMDMLSGEDISSPLDDPGEPVFESVAAATEALLDDEGMESLDSLDDAESGEEEQSSESESTPQNLSMNMNKMFFHVSMASETKTAIGAIASDLKAIGFSTGMVIGGTANSQFRPECGWQDLQNANQPSTTAAALQDKGISAALSRLASAWTPLDDAVRGGDLKVFASLQRDNKKLYGIKFSDSSAKRDTVIVTAMASEICENKDLMQMAADLFKQVAAKGKGAA
jgi:hypothetical protein